MSFTYKILEVTTAHISVDFGNGNWATIPIKKGESKADIEERIRAYATQTSMAYDQLSDVPFSVNDENTILDIDENERAREVLATENLEKTELNYKEQRFPQYPSVILQLEALYKARKGDSTLLDKVDKAIDDLKVRFPKTAPNTTIKQYNEDYESGNIDDTDPKKKRIFSHTDIQTMMG